MFAKTLSDRGSSTSHTRVFMGERLGRQVAMPETLGAASAKYIAPIEVCWLGEPGCDDPAAVGAKAANLGRLAAACRVPPGFCLSAGLFDRRPRSSELAAIISDAYAELVRRCGIGDVAVAVRSSGIDEDTAESSFAGQHETILNVRGAAVVDAVEVCRESARSDRTRAYRAARDLGGEGRIAVLVQRLVRADSALVAFSVDPISGERDQIVVNANWGLGETIVSGEVTPDTYRVRRTDLAIARTIGEKARMTIAAAGGVCTVAVPTAMRSRVVLSDVELRSVARLAIELEARMGWPVALECAFEDQMLYLLQCRPVTTLAAGTTKP